jgi:hypothetical protein
MKRMWHSPGTHLIGFYFGTTNNPAGPLTV